jgi:gliding motility-associated-like protein
MRKLLPFLFLLFALLPNSSKASHVMGMDLTYECLGPNRYLVTLKLYRDCNGITPSSAYTLNYSSAQCGVTSSVSLAQLGQPIDITPLCPSIQSQCNGSNQYGVQKYTYQGILNLPAGCGSDWLLTVTECCRNAAITSLTNPSNENILVEATLNNTLATCDNSPQFLNDPVPFYCANQLSNYNHGATDSDGDSLVFSLVPCENGIGTYVSYKGGYNATSPLATSGPFQLNSNNGQLTFTPSSTQVSVVKVQVDEYRNGVKIGTVVRDMQFIVVNCSNNLPVASGVNGTSNYTFTMTACSNSCFTINSTDGDAADAVTMISNNAIPGATFTTSAGNRPVGTFCWAPTQADVGTYFFTVQVKDDHCQVYGTNTYPYTVIVNPSSDPVVNAGPDVQLCPGQSTTLTATAGSGAIYTWSDGSTTHSGATWTVNPSSTTLYTVTANYPSGCQRTDDVLVTRNPMPTISAYPPVITICSPTDSTQLNASSSTGVTYQWSPTTGMPCPTCQNPQVAPGATTTYSVTAYDANNCPSAPATVQVILNNPPPSQSCTVIYGTVSGTGNGTKANPASLAGALALAQCNNAHVKLGIGNYTIDYPITNIGSNTTIEGGFDPASNWQKSSLAGATTITRSTLNMEGSGTNKRLVAVYLNNASYVRFQDLTFQNTNCPVISGGDVYGYSNYVFHITNSSNYNFVRCQILGGNASAGQSGINGNAGIAGASGLSGGGGSCNGGSCVFGSGDPGGAGGAGGNGGGGAAGGAGGAAVTGSANNGSPGASAVGLNGGAGGGGAAGMDECSTGVSSGAGGGSSVQGAGGNGGGGGNSGDPGGAGANGIAGLAGTNGTNGIPGSLGSIVAGYYNAGGLGTNGTNGVGASGGGGGGGGGRQTCTFCDNGPGNGGGGGGGGGSAGTFGTGGYGGGSSFAVFLNNNGANTNFIDCNIVSGLLGNGGAGGAGGIGGAGGNGGIGASICTGEVGRGGNGGAGGKGGNGGNGGSGADGISGIVYLNNGTAPVTSITNFNLAAQPVIKCDNISCTYTNDNLTATALGAWDAGAGATVPTSTGIIHTTQYTTIGRKDIQYTVNTYTGFVYIAIDQGSFAPNIQTTATQIGTTDTFYLCRFSTANFNAVIASADTFDWNFGGATSPNTYYGSTYQNLNNLSFNTDGVFKIKVRIKTDCCGWSPYDSIYLIVESTPVLSYVGNTSYCPGDSAQITLSGASSYLWTPSSYLSNPTGSSVIAKPPTSTTYLVTGYSPRGYCNKDTAIAITIASPPTITFTKVDATCGPNGSITANTTPSGTYSYVWNPSGTTQTLTGLQAGTYAVTVTDQVSLCSATAATSLSTAGGVQAYIVRSVNPFCFGQNNGMIKVKAIGGTPPYNYTWNTGTTIDSIVNIGNGTYSVTITDANSCSVTASGTLSQPPLLVIEFLDTIDATCSYSCNGSARVDASGGSGGFQFVWNTSPVQDSTVAIGLCSGTYSVTVVDGNGCTASGSVPISAPPAIVIDTVSTLPVSCFGANDGQITLSVSGGVYPYTYSWPQLPSESDSIAQTLYGQLYDVVVTDNNGCIDSAAYLIHEPTQINLTLVSIDSVSCIGGNDGAISVLATGGTAPYTYSLNGGAGQSTGVFGSLTAGTYTIDIADARGCDTSLTIDVYEAPPVSVAVQTFRDVRCFNACDGMIRLTGNGGFLPYQFSIDGVNFQSIDSFNALCNNTYTITIKDRKGCTSTVSQTLAQPTALNIDTTNIIAPTCNLGSNGSVTVIASGGTPGYAYTFDYILPVQLSGNFNPVSSGLHTFIAADLNGCIDSIRVNVPSPPATSTLDTNKIDVICFGGNNGSIDLTVIGAVTPYTYQWSSGEITEDIANKVAGKYIVTVTDGNGCRVYGIDTIEIIQPAEVQLSTLISNVSCNAGTNGCIDLTVTGGTSPYTYVWSNTLSALEDHCGLSAGTYAVTVFDNLQCSATLTSIVVGEPTVFQVNAVSTAVTCPGRTDGTINLTVSGATPNYTYAWSNSATSEDLSGLAFGAYQVTISDANSCTVTASATVGQIPELFINPIAKDVLCEPLKNGSVSTFPTGGTPPYNYEWQNGSTGSYIVGLGAGNYAVTVTDLNGCEKDSSFVIIVSNTFDISATPKDTLVELGETIPIHLDAVGGTMADIVWSPSYYLTCGDCQDPVSSTVNNIVYKVEVVSDSGCIAYDTVSIRINPTYQLYVPNAFTPNGDGVNDYFEIFGNKKVWLEMEMNVFNRWGEKVFESKDMNFQWDGKFRGVLQNPQVYVYELYLTYINGYKMPLQKGSLTLIR